MLSSRIYKMCTTICAIGVYFNANPYEFNASSKLLITHTKYQQTFRKGFNQILLYTCFLGWQTYQKWTEEDLASFNLALLATYLGIYVILMYITVLEDVGKFCATVNSSLTYISSIGK